MLHTSTGSKTLSWSGSRNYILVSWVAGTQALWVIVCCPPRSISRELDHERSSQDVNQSSNMACRHCKQQRNPLHHSGNSFPTYKMCRQGWQISKLCCRMSSELSTILSHCLKPLGQWDIKILVPAELSRIKTIINKAASLYSFIKVWHICTKNTTTSGAVTFETPLRARYVYKKAADQ